MTSLFGFICKRVNAKHVSRCSVSRSAMPLQRESIRMPMFSLKIRCTLAFTYRQALHRNAVV